MIKQLILLVVILYSTAGAWWLFQPRNEYSADGTAVDADTAYLVIIGPDGVQDDSIHGVTDSLTSDGEGSYLYDSTVTEYGTYTLRWGFFGDLDWQTESKLLFVLDTLTVCDNVVNATSTDSIHTIDDSDNPLANVSVTLTQGGLSVSANSDPTGYAIFGLTAGDWNWTAVNLPNTGDNGTHTAGDPADTAVITLFTVSAPSDTNLCTLYGWERIAADTLVGATITIILENVDHDTLLFVNDMGQGTGPRQTRTDSDGYWSMTVIPNSIIDSNSYYHYSRTYGAFKKSFYFVVPDSSTINIADCEKRVQ